MNKSGVLDTGTGREKQSHTAYILVTDHHGREGEGGGWLRLSNCLRKNNHKEMTKLNCWDIDSNNRIQKLKVKKITKQIGVIQLFVSLNFWPVGKATC